MTVRSSVNGRRGQNEVSKCSFDTNFKGKFILLLMYSWGSPMKILQAILTLRLAKWWSSAQDYKDCNKALNSSCKSFLCKFCLDYMMKWFCFSKPNNDGRLCYILRAFWVAMSWMTIIWLDYWSKFGNCEEQERNSIYITVLHENVELSSQISSNVNYHR